MNGTFPKRVAMQLLFFMLSCIISTSAAALVGNRTVNASSAIHNPVAARVIVKFRPEATIARRHALSAQAGVVDVRQALAARAQILSNRYGIQMTAGHAVSEHAQVVIGQGLSAVELVVRLSDDPDVEYAVEDRRRAPMRVPNDPYFTAGPPVIGTTGGPAVGQWYLQPPSADVLSSINAQGAWNFTTGTPSIVVAVLDSGVLTKHPDLAGRLLPGYDMIGDVPTANDGDGRDGDPSDPGDWVSQDEANDSAGAFYQCEPTDSTWHGTQTISLIGATSNNGIGMAGLAWGTRLLPVRVLGKCGGYDSDIIAGMNWAAGLSVPGVPVNPTPARVINISLGGTGSCPQSYIDAIVSITHKDNPAVIISSAGNSFGQAVTSPANCPGIIAVAGLRHTGTKVGYSDLGTEVAISAPAGNCVNTEAGRPCLYPILSASDSGLTGPEASIYTDSFRTTLGTSFSAPLVSGTVALMLSVRPSLTPDEVRRRLQSTARPFPSPSSDNPSIPYCQNPGTAYQLECHCTTATCGAGMLNAMEAVLASGPFPVHRFLNTDTGGHFFTINDSEKETVINEYGWFRYEGIGFHAFPIQETGTLPIYRFFNTEVGSHFFTLSESEKHTVIDNYGWLRFEGIGFYAYPTLQPGTLPVYRFFNSNTGGHFFTISESEKDTVISHYPWLRYEGIGYHASP